MNIQVKKTSVLENQQMFNDGMKDAIKKQAATKLTTDEDSPVIFADFGAQP